MNYSLIIILLCITLTPLANAQKFYVPISQSHDDAEWLDETLDATDFEIDMGWDQGLESQAGFIFRNIKLDKSTTINGAFINFTAQNDFTGGIELLISVENSISPFGYWDSLGLNQRTFLPNQINWAVDSVSKGEFLRTPNLSELINSILARPDWFPGKDIGFVISPAQANDSINLKLEVYSYNQLDSTKYPCLEIYSDPSTNGFSEIINQDIKVFPIPTDRQLSIKSVSAKNIISIEIYTQDGALILRMDGLCQPEVLIDIPQNIPSGAYTLNVWHEAGNSAQWLIFR